MPKKIGVKAWKCRKDWMFNAGLYVQHVGVAWYWKPTTGHCAGCGWIRLKATSSDWAARPHVHDRANGTVTELPKKEAARLLGAIRKHGAKRLLDLRVREFAKMEARQ